MKEAIPNDKYCIWLWCKLFLVYNTVITFLYTYITTNFLKFIILIFM